MPADIDPNTLEFTLHLAKYVLIAFGMMIAGAVLVYIAMAVKGVSGGNIAKVLHEADVPKMTTIIMIICAVSLLALLGIVAGEAAGALLSAIAGYVLGSRTSPKDTQR